MIVSKRKRIILSIVMLLLVGITCFFIYRYVTSEARKVQTIEVKLKTETKMIYSKAEFEIEKAGLIEKLMTFIQDNKIPKSSKENEDTAFCQLTVKYKTGNKAVYQIEEEMDSKKSLLQEVLSDKEVVEQTRSFYTIDASKVKTAELCKWTQNVSNDVMKQQITNKKTVEHLFEICKEYTLSDPADSATFQQSVLYFYDKKGRVLAAFYYNKDSACYKELAEAFPDVATYAAE